MLLRDGTAGPEVLLMERHKTMDFGAGAMVFPGGKVEESDGDPALIAHCRKGEAKADPLLTYRLAAIRELFEEAGILLACHRPGGRSGVPISDQERRQWVDAYRSDILSGDATLAGLAEQEGLVFNPPELVHFAHWVTPEPVAIRFDTQFFAARVPHEQEQCIDGDESVRMGWHSAEDVLKSEKQGDLTMMFPTRLNLQVLAGFGNVADILASRAGQPVTTVTPRIVVEDGQVYVEIPAEAGYGVTRIRREDMAEAIPASTSASTPKSHTRPGPQQT